MEHDTEVEFDLLKFKETHLIIHILNQRIILNIIHFQIQHNSP